MKSHFDFFAAIFAAFAVLATPSECQNINPTNQANGRRRGSLGGASPGASRADCARSMDIKLFQDSPGSVRFKPDMKACKIGKTYVGSTEDGKCHVTLVPSVGNGNGNAVSAFAASVTCDDTGTVYTIGPDSNGTMVVVERQQEDYGPELDPQDDMPPKERALLESNLVAAQRTFSTSGLRGKAADQLRDLGNRFLTENHRNDLLHRDLQSKVVIDTLVLYTAHAECRTAGLGRGCARTTATRSSILNLINLAVSETNTAYSLSGVNVELNLVHAAFDPYVEASSDAFGAALRALSTNGDGNMDQAHTLRTTYGADIVALLIDDPQYCGLAYMGPSITSMFSVTAWNCATGYYSFGHEIGHNLGCNHDKGTENACSNTNYNFGYRDPQAQFRSILAYDCGSGQCDGNSGGGCPRVQRFSNNYANFNMYNGKPIGSAQHDNARRINDVALTVSNYYNKPGTPPTSAPSLYAAPITNMALSEKSIRHYYLDVTAGQTVSCSTSGPNGDADLYLRFGSEAVPDPAFTGNACSSTSDISMESCSTVAASGSTRVYAAVHAFSAFSGLTFQCTKSTPSSSPTSAPPTSAPSLYVTPITNMALSEKSIRHYYLDVTAGQTVSCSTSGPNGDADLYLRFGSEAVPDPAFTGNACSSTSDISTESCSTVAASGSTRVYAAVHAFSAFSGLTLQCTKSTPSSSPTSAPPTSARPTMVTGTAKPTTRKPSTRKPTTRKPTTRKPTLVPTLEPTTESPTTNSPTTDSPTTNSPTTESPTTESPTTASPTTASPTTESPTTESPTTESPTTESPTTSQPTSKPTSAKPTTRKPTTRKPTTRRPTTRKPTTGKPIL